ncbi:TonB-dependent receptor plug domain-containing protein [Teredinibacter turnerae]|uniref:TonB-dependent receptor plug domain-containing protein n=1 Tax=Teredinibacter turnerae TaxID=2426 RepID=UPI0005F805B4|nr:TonB-dependent receptor [Teredinibacter turnerae]
MPNSIAIGLALFLASATQLAVSSEAFKDENKIEQVVITGTRTEKLLVNSPVPIDVVTPEEIEMVATATLAEALGYVKGIYVRNNPKDGLTVFMQGFDANRVVVLLNGLKMISPTGEAVDLDQVGAMDIERIEVVRGASSVLYGSSAMGGVINIITRQRQNNSLHLGYNSGRHISDGEESENREDFRFGGSLARNNFYGQVNYQKSVNPAHDNDPSTVKQDSGSVEKNFLRGAVGAEVGGVTLQYFPNLFEEEKYRVVGAFPSQGNDYYLSSVQQSQHDLSVLGESGWQVVGRYSNHKETSGRRGGLRDTEIKNKYLEGQHVWRTNGMEWVAGTVISNEFMGQIKHGSAVPEIDAKSREGAEFFLQSDWMLSDQFELIAGVRSHHDDDFDHHQAFRLNAMWKQTFSETTQFNWRASAGEGYRIPGLKERYYVFDHSNLGYVVLGGENLVPETSFSVNTSLEVTGRSQSGFGWNAEISFHRSRAKDYILSELDAERTAQESYTVYQYVNRERVRILGGELSLGARFKNQRVKLSYAYLDARDDRSRQRLIERPYHQAKANYWLDIPHINSTFLMYFVHESGESSDDREVISNQFSTFNFAFKTKLKPGISFKLGLDNVFNEHAKADRDESIFLDVRPLHGRYIYAGVSYSFN